MVVTSERLQASSVLIVGDAMLDRYWFGAVERISPEAPVPIVRVEREEERLGGAANVAHNVRQLGAQACLLTVMGVDDPARRLQSLLVNSGVSTLIETDPQVATTVKLRVVGRSQQLMRVDFECQPRQEVLAQLLRHYEDALANCQAVVFSDYGKGGLTHLPRMMELARSAGKPVLVDPKGSDYSRYAGATVITPNRAELAQVIGAWPDEETLYDRVQSLRERHNIDAVLLTRSEEGMSLFDHTGRMHTPARARALFDVTGAGDTVVATLAAFVAAGTSLRDAVPLANQAGGIVVGKFGTASVTYDELLAP